MSNYKTVKDTASATIYEKKSEFIGYISHAKTEKEAQDFINTIRKKHYDATHNCYAFTIKDENIQRQSDDGEPARTAGMPILDVITHSGLDDIVIVVTRYFGGTLLGTGGLVRAYTQGAQAAINAAEVLSYDLCVDYRIDIDYNLYDRFNVLTTKNNTKVLNTDFTDTVSITFRMIKGNQEEMLNDLEILTKGKKVDILQEILAIF